MLTLFIDRFINILKWPTAILALLTLPALALLFIQEMKSVFTVSMLFFWFGLVGYLILWKFVFSAKLWGSWLPTFEHEFTHAIFAIFTLHSIRDFHASWSKGGHVQYVGGEGNWLITIAPYFFPTLALISIGLDAYFPAIFFGHFPIFIGAVLGFQLSSTFREIHREQPDLKKVGFFFSFCFLPSSNFLCLGWIVASARGDTITAYFDRVHVHVLKSFESFQTLADSLDIL